MLFNITTKSMSQRFSETFDKYTNVTDKFGALYIFVIRDVSVEFVFDKIKKLMANADDMHNNVKKNHIKGRLHKFVNVLENEQLSKTVNNIYLVSNDVNVIAFDDYWIETLNMFNCDSYLVKYGDEFQLEWLRDYLLDRSYVNVLQLQNNNIKHIHLNSTKRVTVKEHTEKKCELNEFISNNIPSSEYCVVHGVSSFMKQLVCSNMLIVLNGTKRDDELLLEYNKILNSKRSIELEKWLEYFNNPDSKEYKRIIIGKDNILQSMNYNELKIIYCLPKIKKNILKNFTGTKTFELVEIKSYDNNDTGHKLKTIYDGIIGIKFY